MKTQTLLRTYSVRRLLLTVPVICSMGFAGCSDVARTAGIHSTARFQSQVVGERQSGDNVTIGPATYNSEAQSFESPWPFGPEFNPQ